MKIPNYGHYIHKAKILILLPKVWAQVKNGNKSSVCVCVFQFMEFLCLMKIRGSDIE